MIEIANENLRIGVQPRGAELCSIKNLKTGTEYIWQADPKIWPSHAPNLFPIIGLLKEGSYFYEGKEYDMPKHGFVRHNAKIKLKRQKETSLTFELKYSEDTLKMYPFRFRFQISFSLEDKTLRVSHKVSNLDDRPLYFSLGGHPAFNAPLKADEEYEDYYLQFDQNIDLESFVLNSEGLVTQKTKTIAENGDKISLRRDLFDEDALIFKNIPSKKVSLISEKSGPVLTVTYEDFRNLGIWAKPGAPYVCIEPWLGIADVEGADRDIKKKEGIVELMPSESFNASYSITIA